MMAQQINVSIVTVTKDRPAFVGHLRHNIDSLDYDRKLLEWVVVDDGREPILDYVRDFPGLVYYYSKQHISLGKKRNLANSLTTGEVIFNFDDDNYAFSNRIERAVAFLSEHPEFEIVGSSEMFILDIDIGQIYVAGPYAKNHATLGTWAFRRSLLAANRFVDTDSLREEAGFTNGWTIPIGQLDKRETSVCVDHGSNTVSKKHLLHEAGETFAIDEIIDDDFSRSYFQQLIARRKSEQIRST